MTTESPTNDMNTKRTHARRSARAKDSAAEQAAEDGSARRGRDGDALVVVESPTKARTIGRILGDGYHVVASKGHVRDLPESGPGALDKKDDIHLLLYVDDVKPRYVVPKDKLPVIKEIAAQASKAPAVYLATDPDREGEAIAWHLAESARIPPDRIRRVTFHEITADAVRDAFNHPREIDSHLVDAQQARRIMDRLVGYQLSPLISRKVQRGLSAGRVQSVALRLVVERDRAIEAFVPVEYWTLDALLQKREDGQQRQFWAQLSSIQGEKERIALPDQAATDTVVTRLQGAAYQVSQVTKREVRRRPSPPFITSTLQQEANRRLRWPASRTMAVAQQLYEGVALGGEGSVGLITYMRTDSTDVAASALQETRGFIRRTYGNDYMPESPRVYTRKVKGAQEAHEAVRPTSVVRTPQTVQRFLSAEQFRLYDLIWKRMVASQMADAVLDATQVDIAATPREGGVAYAFRANGSVLKFPGFRTVYMESTGTDEDEDKESRLPELARGDVLACAKLDPKQHFTEPPPRYTEASLIRALEEDGIGRPSTYAPIISTLVARHYVTRERGSLRSTQLGRVVNDQLVTYFPKVMDLGFTAHMEEELDDVASGERQWVPVVRDFYDPFEAALIEAQEKMPRVRVEEPSNEVCDVCGKPMVIKTGRYGRFLSCSGFPDCRNSRPLIVKTGAECPQCGGDLVERKPRTGRRRSTFYGCSNYPTCNFAVNSRPLPEPCPECGGLLVAAGRRTAKCTKCAYKGEISQVAEKVAED